MAHGFRHITNRLANINNILSPRNHVVAKENNTKPFLTIFVQYSTRVNPVWYYSNDKVDGDQPPVDVDNRETVNDIVIKENICRIENDYLRVRNSLTHFSSTNSLYNIPQQKDDPLPNKPSAEKLQHVYNVLADTLPKLFIQPMDYTIYHPEVIFEDNIRSLTTKGLYNYIKQVALLRTVGHLKFAYVKFEILKITQHPEDSTIKVRWQIRGISALKVMITFWKFKLWNYREMFDRSDSWYDGFSTFHVNHEGQVIKHVADKMMPDSDAVQEQSGSNPVMAASKLALIVGIIPKFSF